MLTSQENPVMAVDKKYGKPAGKARHAPIQNTHYTDAELNARVRNFPPLADVWKPDGSVEVLLNPDQPLDIVRHTDGEHRVKTYMGYNLVKINGMYEDPVLITIRAHLRLRMYRLSVIVETLDLPIDEWKNKTVLYGWHLSDYDRRRSAALLEAFYNTGRLKFKKDACQIYHDEYGDWLSRRTKSRRSISNIASAERIIERVSFECSILEVLRRAVGDAKCSASEWSSILSGNHTPSLNKLHRIVNPRQVGNDEMTDDEMFITSIVTSFFGCTNAAHIYPELARIEEVLQFVCFLGRVNLGEIWPTIVEAEAAIKYCNRDIYQTMTEEIKSVMMVVDNICKWTKYKSVLLNICESTIQAHQQGDAYPCRYERLWSSI